jgi:hypothetical protein
MVGEHPLHDGGLHPAPWDILLVPGRHPAIPYAVAAGQPIHQSHDVRGQPVI